eukprot:TRINITY_DN1513_c3_g1_i1.p1 TRINITY_DN1513_c3_g1~~TRINITY_DN1513_c3_g1_i1.p1  ORF type:complete len:1235 (-),score=350.60 TRINITY_DN1513_c3_g1_i1:195-3899(-)
MMHSFSTLGRRCKNSPNKWRMGNEQKFMGEGQTFKGKLIGVLEVQNARGDRMCQDALQELKIAVKASGEHKQRVIIHIAVDGLKIRDEKNGDCLYHHPVHKISFIAQDMADSRAFGYIYGSPENGHRFFGIKTEKAAAQVVVAMRDLFQVVFDLKQQEIEQTKKQLDTLPGGTMKREDTKKPDVLASTSLPQSVSLSQSSDPSAALNNNVKNSGGGGALSDLLGLQDELTHIQAGIRQIDKIAPTAPMSFQTDSMIPLSGNHTLHHGQLVTEANQHHHQHQQGLNKRPAAIMNSNPVGGMGGSDAFGAAPFLPPPPSKSGNRTSRAMAISGNDPIYGTHPQNTPPMHSASPMLQLTANNNNNHNSGSPSPMAQISKNPTNMIHNTLNNMATDKYKSFESFEDPSKFGGFHLNNGGDPNDLTSKSYHGGSIEKSNQGMMSNESFESVGAIPQFTDLDPLGSGKSKPYMERKDFFSELKTPSARMSEIASSPGSDVLSSSVGSLTGAFGPTPSGDPSKVQHQQHQPHSFSDNFSSDSPTMWHCGNRGGGGGVNNSYSKEPRKPPSMGISMPITVDSGEESHYGGFGHLKVPDEGSNSGENTYGSIPHLEASPRRYRRDLFPPSGTMSNSLNLGIPSIVSSKKTCDQYDSDTPPKLPERPSKASTISPPPLPPKKPLSQQNSWKLMSSSITTIHPPRPDNIYDFPLDPPSQNKPATPPVTTSVNPNPNNNFVSIEELSKMSVMELNAKMTSGQLPVELQGMSILALVDYISAAMKKNEPSSQPYPFILHEERKHHPQARETSMKPSFSDNFVSPSKSSKDTQQEDEEDEKTFFTEAPSSSSLVVQEAEIRCPSPFESSEQHSGYDKYAVLRELVLEDEIMRAWKSEDDEELEESEDDKTDDEIHEVHPIIPSMNGDSEDGTEEENEEENVDNFRPRSPTPSEDKVISDEEEEEDESQEDKETRRYFHAPPPVCSSEGSPCSRSESDEDPKSEENSTEDNHKRDSTVPLCEDALSSRCPSTQFEDNFSDAFGCSSDPLNNPPGGWTTFEEEMLPPSSSQYTMPQDKNVWDKPSRPGVVASSASKNYFHSLRFKTDSPGKYSIEDESSDSSGRPGGFSRNESLRGSDLRFREEERRRRRLSSSGDHRSTPNPFNDNFMPTGSDEGRKSEVSSSLNEFMEHHHENLQEVEDDIFECPHILEDSGFRVTAKVIHSDSHPTKSDSVNIFEVKEDPFDDDFFK